MSVAARPAASSHLRGVELEAATPPPSSVDLRQEFDEVGIGEVLDQLDHELIGLKPVKTRIREIASLLLIERIRKRMELTSEVPTLHMSFTGNPGTGKTTVALRMASILHKLGFVRRGQVVSVTRDELVGQYIGHTAPKTKEILKKAMGGVLFIDEAYYLYRPDNERDYGQEAIEILLQVMESQREDLVVILAGYGDRMDKFFASNPGFRSRIAHHIDFPDYSDDELLAIAELMLRDMNYRFSAGRAGGLHALHRTAQDPAAVLQCTLDPKRARPHAAAPGQPPRHRSRSRADRGRHHVPGGVGCAGQQGIFQIMQWEGKTACNLGCHHGWRRAGTRAPLGAGARRAGASSAVGPAPAWDA